MGNERIEVSIDDGTATLWCMSGKYGTEYKPLMVIPHATDEEVQAGIADLERGGLAGKYTPLPELTEPEWLLRLREGLEKAPHPLNLYETGKDLVAVVVRLRADLAIVTGHRNALLVACEKFVETWNRTGQRVKLDVARRLAEQAIEKATQQEGADGE